MSAALFSLLCLPTIASAQTLVTDKFAYLPGETVYFAGSGFQPGEDVGLTIHVTTNNEEAIDYAIGGIVVDAVGEFTATWLVPAEAVDSFVNAFAMGLSSRKIRATSFSVFHLPTVVGFEISHASGVAGGPQFVRLSVLIAPEPDSPFHHVLANVSSLGQVSLPLSVLPGGFSLYEKLVPAPCGVTLTFSSVRVITLFHSFHRDVTIFPDGLVPTATTAACSTCLVNTPPIIACDDFDLGDSVGCLAEGFSKAVTVSASDFACTATDPDGDPVTLTFLGPSDLTLVGPGEVEATVTFSATDDPSGRQASSTCPLLPATTTQTASVRARIVYDFEGPLAPLEPDVLTLKKLGNVVQINFRLRDCAGTALCPSNCAPLAADATRPRLEAQAVTVLSPGGVAAVEDAGSFDCVPDQLIGFQGPCSTGQWSYHLTTKSGAWTAGLTYEARILPGDGTVHPVFFSLKK